jgi:hypothetical protein
MQGPLARPLFTRLHPQDALVETPGARDVRDGENDVVESINVHRVPAAYVSRAPHEANDTAPEEAVHPCSPPERAGTLEE